MDWVRADMRRLPCADEFDHAVIMENWLIALAIGITAGVLGGIVGTLAGVVGALTGSIALMTLLATLMNGIPVILVEPFSSAILVVLYFELRARSEGFDLSQRVAQITVTA